MRHVLVHGYYQIRPQQLWDTVEADIEPLKPIIQSLYEQEQLHEKCSWDKFQSQFVLFNTIVMCFLGIAAFEKLCINHEDGDNLREKG